jgi:hypothetical protein
MNIKIEIIKALVFSFIGFFIALKVIPNKSSNTPLVAQNQSQECKVVTKKIISKDGTVSEITEVAASGIQSQSLKKDEIDNFKTSVFLGLATDKKASLNVIFNKWSHELRTDFNKDNVYQLSYKVLEF